ncbi:MAG: ribbon-helix-helix protein, CopG family [Desulforhopalus sp.]
MQTAEKLVRKQFLISPKQVKKLELLAKKQNTSAAEMVRCAIDAYDIDASAGMEESELLDLVSTRVKEAIADTQKIRQRLDHTFRELNVGGH